VSDDAKGQGLKGQVLKSVAVAKPPLNCVNQMKVLVGVTHGTDGAGALCISVGHEAITDLPEKGVHETSNIGLATNVAKPCG
jgi:hypothetical protein